MRTETAGALEEDQRGDGPLAKAPAPFHRCPSDPACPYCSGSITGTAEALDWSFVDAVYCISLETRDDRAAAAAAQFHKVGLCRHVVFYRPQRHPTKPLVGIWESHRAVGMQALQAGCERVLIFEDDVRFVRRIRPRTLRSIARALDGLPADWTILFLGHWPLSGYFVRWNLLRVSSACAHAYVASKRLLVWLSEHPFRPGSVPVARIAGRGIDAAYAKLPGTYAVFPMLATQSASRSDHLTYRPGRGRERLKHLVTRSRHRERLLSALMRPNELLIAALSPMFFLIRVITDWPDR